MNGKPTTGVLIKLQLPEKKAGRQAVKEGKKEKEKSKILCTCIFQKIIAGTWWKISGWVCEFGMRGTDVA